tara:strand:+ start:1178 stop:1321 length:144 start_codon:yes stop_codon:yes gene_type:complete
MVFHGNALITNRLKDLVHRKIEETVRRRSKRDEEIPEAMKVALGFAG